MDENLFKVSFSSWYLTEVLFILIAFKMTKISVSFNIGMNQSYLMIRLELSLAPSLQNFSL